MWAQPSLLARAFRSRSLLWSGRLWAGSCRPCGASSRMLQSASGTDVLSSSAAALAGVLLAAYVYVRTDSTLGVEGSAGAAWLLIWWCLLAFQMTYGKHLTNAVEMSESERVFYSNALSLPPTAALCFVMGEHRDLSRFVLEHLLCSAQLLTR